jgi:enediyne biosynthesis protein E4
MTRLYICAICVFVLLFACRKETQQAQKPNDASSIYIDATKHTGIDFIHEPGVDDSYFMPESLGSGCAFFDYDNDGLLDVYLINSGWHANQQNKPRVTNHLFHQNRDHTFTDVTEKSGLTGNGYGMGVAIGDYDNDGFVDVYVTNYGSAVLYHNNGNGTFTDATKTAGVNDPYWGTSAAFFDYDRDGFLDLFVANYVKFDPKVVCMDKAGRLDYCGPQGYSGEPDKLFHNNGNGTFTDVSDSSGITKVAGKGLGVFVFDFNHDTYPDIYVANDGEPNFLWINQQNGTFVDQASPSGAAVNASGQPEAGMGVTGGDLDGSGNLDLFITHLRDEKNTLYKNNSSKGFQDESWALGLAGPSLPYTGFGTGFFDYDNDGDLDLAVVNGRVTRGPLLVKTEKPGYWDYYAEPNQLYQNDGTGHFKLAANDAGPFASTIENSRGLAFGDFDNDGDIDLLVSNEGGPAHLYRNDLHNNNHWLTIRAVDPKLHRDAIGAEVTVVVNGKRLMQPVTSAYSYLSSNDFRVHFGLGSATSVEAIEIRWPNGTLEKFPGVRGDQFIQLSPQK